MLNAAAKPLVKLVERYLPDPYVFVLLLSVVVFCAAMLFEQQSPLQVLQYWGDGFWGLLSFSMQMLLVLVTGFMLANTPLVRVYDYDQSIVVVGPANGLSGLDWQKPEGNATDYLDFARGRTSRELVLRWRSPSTCDVPWDVTVRRSEEYGIYISPSIRGEGCSGETVTRRIVIEFEDPVDMDRIQGPSCCG